MPYSMFPYFIFLSLAIVWSGSFIAIKFSLVAFDPIFAALLRVFVAFFFLSLWFMGTRTPLRLPLKTMCLLWFLGIISQSLAFIFLFWGEQYIAPALASVINATVPLWVFCISTLVFRDKAVLTTKKIAGLLLGFIGILFIFGPLVSFDHNIMTLLGALSVSGMAISYAVGAILYKRLINPAEVDFKASIWHQHAGSFVFLFFFSCLGQTWPPMDIFTAASWPVLHDAIIAVIYLGVFSTALAWMIYFHLIVIWGTVRTVSVLYIVPVFAIVWDLIFLHLSISVYTLCGVSAILLGVLFVQTAENKLPAPQKFAKIAGKLREQTPP